MKLKILPPQLALDEIAALRLLLGRCTLQGTEVGGFIAIANKLTDIEQYLTTPKARRGNKDLPPAR